MSELKTQNQNLNPKANLRRRTYLFSLCIIKLVSTFPEKKVFWIIGDQLLRSATSIGANIIEATASSSRRDFIRFYEIALKSANETVYWISLLKDSGLVELIKCEETIDECSQISKMLGASLLTLKNKR